MVCLRAEAAQEELARLTVQGMIGMYQTKTNDRWFGFCPHGSCCVEHSTKGVRILLSTCRSFDRSEEYHRTFSRLLAISLPILPARLTCLVWL